MSRNLLHKSELKSFMNWLDSQNIPHREPRGLWEVLQVQLHPPQWYCVYNRLVAPEHYTVDRRLEACVRRFIEESK